MNHHSVLFKAIPKPKIKSTKILRKADFYAGKTKTTLKKFKIVIVIPKIDMAERTGLEPASPYGR